MVPLSMVSSSGCDFAHLLTPALLPQRMVVGNHNLQERQPSPWGRSPVSFEQIGPDSVFFRGSRVKGPSSLALLRMVPHQWPVALAVIWHIYSCLACSSEDSARDLPSSGKVVLVQGQVPCEFWSDWPGFSFSGEELRQGSFQPCPAQDGASSMVGGSRRDLAHLLTPVLFLKEMVVGTCHLQGRSAPTMGQVPCEFQADWPGFSFSGEELRQGSFQPCPAQDGALSMARQLLSVIWHIYSGQCIASREF